MHTFGQRRIFWGALSPDGTTLALEGAEDGTIGLWDVGTGKELLNVPVPFPGVLQAAAAFSPDGRKLACVTVTEDSVKTRDSLILICDFHAYDEDRERWLREAGVPVPASAQAGAHPTSP
jgi:hypothetical protein